MHDNPIIKLSRMLFFRKDGSLNLLGKIALILSILFAGAIASMFSGCVNIYTRCPTTDARIESCYQSTRVASAFAVVASFPQMMSDAPSDYAIQWENIFTVPFLGLPCSVDACLEAVVDTVCLPYDYPISKARKK